MKAHNGRSLDTARWIAIAMYVAGLVIYPVIGVSVKPSTNVEPDVLRLLGPLFLAVAVADYAVSLVLERIMLARARGRAEGTATAFTTALIVSACGESLAVFGLVIHLLGAPNWALALYSLCAVHGLHLMIRWPEYDAAAGPSLSKE